MAQVPLSRHIWMIHDFRFTITCNVVPYWTICPRQLSIASRKWYRYVCAASSTRKEISIILELNNLAGTVIKYQNKWYSHYVASSSPMSYSSNYLKFEFALLPRNEIGRNTVVRDIF
ncbi:conserved hypothetical protein [Trichinella spiralis]|uniref:hypothetical protein n=1 Tax=Trichinella spiralis TaxID=6334 RepID=UPI0001EFE982|nr:conserved hypothetical protein [Trichinella spiralis]